MLMRLVHVFASNLFIFIVYCIALCESGLRTYSPVDEHLDCFRFGAVNKIVMSILVFVVW